MLQFIVNTVVFLAVSVIIVATAIFADTYIPKVFDKIKERFTGGGDDH